MEKPKRTNEKSKSKSEDEKAKSENGAKPKQDSRVSSSKPRRSPRNLPTTLPAWESLKKKTRKRKARKPEEPAKGIHK